MEGQTVLDSRDSNTIMVPIITNFNNSHQAGSTIIITTSNPSGQQITSQPQTIQLPTNQSGNVITVSGAALAQAIQQQQQQTGQQITQLQVTQVTGPNGQTQLQLVPVQTTPMTTTLQIHTQSSGTQMITTEQIPQSHILETPTAQIAIQTTSNGDETQNTNSTTVGSIGGSNKRAANGTRTNRRTRAKQRDVKAEQEQELDTNAAAALAGLASNSDSLLACMACGKNFVSYGRLKSHEKTHTKQRPFKCTECDKTFTVRYSLICHTRVHSRERPYSCSQCGARFSQASSLKTHQIYKHTKEFPYTCKYCGRGFISPGQKHEHINRTHLRPSGSSTGSGSNANETGNENDGEEVACGESTGVVSTAKVAPTRRSRRKPKKLIESKGDSNETKDDKTQMSEQMETNDEDNVNAILVQNGTEMAVTVVPQDAVAAAMASNDIPTTSETEEIHTEHATEVELEPVNGEDHGQLTTMTTDENGQLVETIQVLDASQIQSPAHLSLPPGIYAVVKSES
jgi:DNA-directed RNA polymerase subunit RPC12/RpoP